STGESCMLLYLDTATGSGGSSYDRWNFAVTSANATSRTRTVASTGSTNPVHVGSWTHIAAVTYSASGKYIEIYVDGIPAASATPSTTWSSGCTSFELARQLDQGGTHSYFPGEIADVQTWAGTVLTPTQIADLSGTPGYDLFPSDGTQITSAASASTYQWQTACAEMQFYQGKLTVKETCTGSSSVSYGPGGYPDAVLTLQKDGNLVIYGSYGTVLWKTGTDN
ncbi:MAG: LamG-like jellyroll fold domain-containing protein, partial [Trebonia sp.]